MRLLHIAYSSLIRRHRSGWNSKPRREPTRSQASFSLGRLSARGKSSINISVVPKAPSSGLADRRDAARPIFWITCLRSRAGPVPSTPETRGGWCADLNWPAVSRRRRSRPIFLTVLAEQIGADARSGDLYRQMRGAAALNVALESARRTGIRAV